MLVGDDELEMEATAMLPLKLVIRCPHVNILDPERIGNEGRDETGDPESSSASNIFLKRSHRAPAGAQVEWQMARHVAEETKKRFVLAWLSVS